MNKIDDINESRLSDLLSKIPSRKQRQDSVSDQLSELRMVANKLGMYDAADAIKQWCVNMPKLKYGCFIDGEPFPDCVLDYDAIHECCEASEGMRKEKCEYWRPLVSS